MGQRGGLNAWMFYQLECPTRLPYRVDKLLDGEWRVMGWYGYRDERERLLADGIGSAAQACEVLGGVCRIVETSKTAFKREWKAVA